ncbi:MAG: site-specific DNA-methyltransferase [Desulfurococcales archaeon ex4484_217_2]|nr:MAG: site-specific DNA-methyltransferase [Desulfurococcales archaeon ex4484_217_2]
MTIQRTISSSEIKKWKRYNGKWVPKVIVGDVRKIIPKLPNNFIDCVITSPPYWMQRDYGHPDQIGREPTPEAYVKEIVHVFELLKPKLKKTATIFLNVGYKYWKEEMILIPEMIAIEMQKHGYMLKNKIIWHKPNAMPTPARNRLNNVYEPVLLFVKREAKEFYYFNLEEVAEKPKTILDYHRLLSLKPEDYLGARVIDSLRYREKMKGIVVGVRYSDSKVYEILVKWNNNTLDWIPLGEPLEKYPEHVNFNCPYCKHVMGYWDILLSIANNNRVICPHCGKLLGTNQNNFPEPILTNNYAKIKEVKEIIVEDVEVKKYITKTPKSSKYLIVGQVFSSSPAGRLAISGEYIVIKRRWKIPQPLIAEYLRFWRIRRRVPIKKLDLILGYRDTAGHWFRKDFGEWGKGGSLPRPADWLKLKKILGFNDTYDRVMTEIIGELQTVKPHEEGKNPGDVWSIKLEQFPGAHFAIFPRNLVEKALKLGCPPNGVVLDPFAGSGTVGEVAMKLGRKAILIELISKYVELIKRRCGVVELIKL